MTVEFVGDAAGVRFAVKVVPGAARDRIVGALGPALKLQVAAPPAQGRANARVCELLAAALRLPARAVQITSGHGSARKLVTVRGLDVETVRARLLGSR